MTHTVTVLLTVYNGMPYLPHTVSSILGQTLPDFSFLILNNGSTDGTAAWLDTQTDPRLTIHHLPENIGRTNVLNKGLAMIQTPYTAIVDADDLAAPTRLEKQIRFLNNHPDIDLCGSDVLYINPASDTIGYDTFACTHEDIRRLLPLHNQFAHAACCYRTDAARRSGGYPANFPYAQDFALWMQMMIGNSRVASIDEPLASIRVHPQQATRSSALKETRARDNHQLARLMLRIPGMPPASRQAALLRSAGALWMLNEKKAACKEAMEALMTSPFLPCCNPILWQRIRLEVKRRLHPLTPS